MVNLVVVSRLGGPVDLAQDGGCDLYQDIKCRTLHYCDVLLSQGQSPAPVSVRKAPLGAVRTRTDAERFIGALSQVFTNTQFFWATIPCKQGEEIVFVPHERDLAENHCDLSERAHDTIRFDGSAIGAAK